MNRVVDQALAAWGMGGAAYRLVAARENAVYEVTTSAGRAALRLHRRNYRTDAALRSELAWMATAARAGISVPSPIRAADGAALHRVEGIQVDMLTWLDGITMKDALATLAPGDQVAIFSGVGRELARLHQASDAWTPSADFTRDSWDRDGLLGEAPLWDRFWENPDLSHTDRALFENFRNVAGWRLGRIGETLDYGLIHADLVPQNVLIDGTDLHLIDFDDGGFGFRLFDIATALLKYRDAPHFPQIQTSLLAGYRDIRCIDTAELDLFLALRAATYVGWNIKRMQEPGGQARNGRFINTLRRTASHYLQTMP